MIPMRLGAGALAFVLLCAMGGRPPEGPVPIIWDEETCAECHMHIGDPRFGAQLQLRTEELLDFDDPGCLFRYLRGHADVQVHAIWFRDSEADRWIAHTRAHFVESRETPMGSGLAAIDGAREGAIDYQQARQRSGR